MATVEVKVPDIGDFKDVEVIELLVKPGDRVKAEQSLVTVESDKASMEIPSSHAGVVKDLKVKLGDKVSEGSLVLVLDAASGAPAAAAEPASAPTPARAEPPAVPSPSQEAPAPSPATAPSASSGQTGDVEIVVEPPETKTSKKPPGPLSVSTLSVPSHSWQTVIFAPSIPVSPASWMPLLFASLKTTPHTPPDPQKVCADTCATATDASGRSAAARAAALMCFSGPSSNCCVWFCRSVRETS